MTTFTARVELLNAGPKDYDRLQSEMKKETFTAAGNKASDGHVEFKCKDKGSIREVIDSVLRAASKTGRKFTFTVMKDKQIEKAESRMRYA
jgi:hypothetical protein